MEKIEEIYQHMLHLTKITTVSVTFIYSIKLNSQLTEKIFFKIIKEKHMVIRLKIL